MTIQISKTTKKETKKFNKEAWREVDIEHYGEQVRWDKKKFKFKATENDTIVGTIHGTFEAGVLYIDSLIVAKDKRGLGIGKKLIEEAEAFGKKLGAHKVFLVTMEGWEAIGFYKHLGYSKTGDFEKHYLKRDWVIYSKFI